MSPPLAAALQQYLRRLCEEAVPSEDDVLLKRFVEANDRSAFELLIARHGPMVLGTARRLVGNTHDAEDVFQAVFLSLARLARTIRQGQTLPAWLHKATCRVAARIRANRPVQSFPPAEPYEQGDPGAGLVWQEVRQALDEELQRLPQRLRSPLLLCYLSGLTRDEAAKQLGWSLGTLKRRLEAGRKALRIRLERRGIGAVGLALAVVTPEALRAAVSNSLAESSLALIFSTRAVVPATIAALTLNPVNAMKGLAMKAIVGLFAACAVSVVIYAATGQAEPPNHAEGQPEEVKPAREEQVMQRNDPLPPGSTRRFGTSRFRHGIPVSTLAISPDGKMAFVANDNHMEGMCRAFDLASGRVLYPFENWSGVEVGVFSPDGRTLVTKETYDLHVRDAATGKILRTIKGPRTNSWDREWLEFTPDGKAIAVTSQRKVLHLIDFANGNPLRDFVVNNPESALGPGWPSFLGVAFSPDGKRMASGGYDNDQGNYFARLWDMETGQELRRFMHGKQGYGVRCLAFSPDGKTLATLGTQGGAFLRLFDVATGNERKAFPKDGDQRTTRGSVIFSPDGKTVAAAGASIRLYDPTTGAEQLRIDRSASDLHFTDGGKTLTAAVSGAIYRWDTATGKLLTPEAGDSVVEQILVTPDGRRLVTRSQNGDAHIWDATSGKHLHRLPVGWQRGLAISPDGRFLAWPVDDSSVSFTVPRDPRSTYHGTRIRLYDIAADRLVDRFAAYKGDAQDLAFTSDGKQLVTVDQNAAMARVWNFADGKEVRSFAIMPDALKKQAFLVRRTQLSPDGKTAVVTYEENLGGRFGGLAGPPQHVRLWDVAVGKELAQPNGGRPLDQAFSPDGRLVVTTGGNGICETATGSRVAALPDALRIRAAAFSRDGRFLAIAGSDHVMQIWEVPTWTKRNEFKGHRDRPTALAFAPGGQLFSGSLDTTVLAWDTRPPRVTSSVTLESAWNDLAAREADIPFRSEGRFLAAPAETVKLFAAKVQPVAALDPKWIRRLLADLGSDLFDIREAASKTLLELDHQAIPYLEDTLKNVASVEVRRRLKPILEHQRRAAISAEQLRQIRAVMILELIGDGASKVLLERWATGPAGALLTLEASASLQRLEAVAKTIR